MQPGATQPKEMARAESTPAQMTGSNLTSTTQFVAYILPNPEHAQGEYSSFPFLSTLTYFSLSIPCVTRK